MLASDATWCTGGDGGGDGGGLAPYLRWVMRNALGMPWTSTHVGELLTLGDVHVHVPALGAAAHSLRADVLSCSRSRSFVSPLLRPGLRISRLIWRGGGGVPPEGFSAAAERNEPDGAPCGPNGVCSSGGPSSGGEVSALRASYQLQPQLNPNTHPR